MLRKFTRFRKKKRRRESKKERELNERFQDDILDCWLASLVNVSLIRVYVQSCSYENLVRFESFVILLKNDDSDAEITNTWNIKKTSLEVLSWCKLASHFKRIFVWWSFFIKKVLPLAYSARILGKKEKTHRWKPYILSSPPLNNPSTSRGF
jgi:hypothetical protein